MMYPSPTCEICLHYTGGKVFGEINTKDEFVEGEFLPTCKAFPDGIPEEISSGENKHTKPLKSQKNSLVFEDITKKGGS